MKVGGQLLALATLPLGKTPVPTGMEAGWTAEPVQMPSFQPAGNLAPVIQPTAHRYINWDILTPDLWPDTMCSLQPPTVTFSYCNTLTEQHTFLYNLINCILGLEIN
jgi:hypothetical protein